MFNDPKSRWVLVVLPRYYFTWKPWRLLGGRDVNGTASIVLCSYFSSRLPSISYMRWGSFSIACVCHDTPDCTHNLILLLTRLCNKWGCCCKWRHIRQDCVSNLIIVLCDHLYAPARRTATDTLPRIAGSTPSSTRRFAIHACLSLLATFRASFAMYSA